MERKQLKGFVLLVQRLYLSGLACQAYFLNKESHFLVHDGPCEIGSYSFLPNLKNRFMSTGITRRLVRLPSCIHPVGKEHENVTVKKELRMKTSHSVRKACLASIVGLGITFSFGTASASDCHPPKYVYKTVTVYETVRQPIVKSIVKYDHCHKAYVEKVVTYKVVQIAVEKRIRIAL